jgi:hypothetical protein
MRKRAQDERMKTLPRNVVPFVLRGLPPLDKLDQSMMRKLRKLADRTGWTVEDLINEGILKFVTKCQAKAQLETKIIRFPKAMRLATKRGSNKCVRRNQMLLRHIADRERLPRQALDE